MRGRSIRLGMKHSCDASVWAQVTVTESAFATNFVYDTANWGRNYLGGGGLYVYGEAVLTMNSSTFKSNGAEVGGGAVVRGNCTVNIAHCSFEDNLAVYSGGGMAISVSMSGGITQRAGQNERVPRVPCVRAIRVQQTAPARADCCTWKEVYLFLCRKRWIVGSESTC